MVTHEWGVRWFDTGNVTPTGSREDAEYIISRWPDKATIVSRWLHTGPWS